MEEVSLSTLNKYSSLMSVTLCHLTELTCIFLFSTLDLVVMKVESQDLYEMEEEDPYDKRHGEKLCSQTEKEPSQKKSRKKSFKNCYICPQCGRNFTYEKSLKKHELMHNVQCPFTCQQCGNIFTTNGSLKNHMRIHTGEKPFTCVQCGKSYTRSKTLKDHMRIHTGERPFKCDQCGKSYIRSKTLKDHMRNSHWRKTFQMWSVRKEFHP